MNFNIQKFIIIRWTVLVLLASAFFFMFTNILLAETTVSNTVRVEAGGSGQAYAAVTTIVDGVVVEDWEATSSEAISYTYSSASIATDDNPVVDTESSSQEEHDRLVELIAHLQALILLYVSLLTP